MARMSFPLRMRMVIRKTADLQVLDVLSDFLLRSEMQIHSKSLTGAKPHKCPPCPKTFANSSHPAQHTCSHSGAKPYSCNFSGQSFCQRSHLQQHTQTHTRDKPCKCAHPGCEKASHNSIL